MYEFVVPCNFALEAVVGREIEAMGYKIIRKDDGRVTFEGDDTAFAKANIWLRSGERLLLKLSEFKAVTFEELFQGVKKIEWEKFIPEDGDFPVTKAASTKSVLFSTSDIQAITKKAVVEALKRKYDINAFHETGELYPIQVFFMKDMCSVYLDCSGAALHKRGYRIEANVAPLKETLAAALIQLTPWRMGRELTDPFCGSGTICIEAAMYGMNMAPGIERSFNAEKWDFLKKDVFKNARQEAKSMIKPWDGPKIKASDINPEYVELAKRNADRAGVIDAIDFSACDFRATKFENSYGFLVSNPPYGERMEDQGDLNQIYFDLGKIIKRNPTWSFYVLNANETFEKSLGLKAERVRKLYNGMMKANYYQYPGVKPPKVFKEDK